MSRILIAAAASLIASTAVAQDHDWGARHIDRRQDRQEFRIHQGVRSGEITRREHWRLEREQAHVRYMERAARSDGYVSPYERARIRAAQDAASRHIAREAHDGQRRWFARYW